MPDPVQGGTEESPGETVAAAAAGRSLTDDLGQAFEQGAVAMCLASLDGRILTVNAAFAELTGSPAGDLVGRPLGIVLSPDDQRLPDLEPLRAGRTRTLSAERRLARADGAEIWGLFLISPVGARRDRPEQLLVQVQDVSESHAITEALVSSERRIRLLAEGAVDFVLFRMRLRPSPEMEYVSPGVEAMTGHPPAAFHDDPGMFLRLIHPEDAARLAADLGTGPTELDRPFVYRWIRADGAVVWTQSRVIPILDSAGRMVGIEGIAHDITERKSLEAQLAHQALHDPLTDLPNRVLFLDRLEHALRRVERRGTQVAVVFIDLDHFKLINDSLGHEAGDRLLRTVAERLTTCLRQGDTAARLGGDEFVACLEDLADPGEAVEISRRIHEAVAVPLLPDATQVVFSASLGIAFADSAVPSHELLRDADLAMYAAKQRGRNRIEIFEGSMRERLGDVGAAEAALRGARWQQEQDPPPSG